LDVQAGNDQRSLESRLGEQGFVPGTPAYAQAMQTFMDTKNRAYADARDRATTQGFDQGLRTASFGNTARGQSISERLALRNQPLNELNSFRSGTQVEAPNFNGQYGTPGQRSSDIVGAGNSQYNAALGQYNAGTASNTALTNNLFGLTGALLNSGLGQPKKS
jgi:hypothetical protein